MEGSKLKKYLFLGVTAFIAWWFLGRKKDPSVADPIAPIPTVPRPGEFVSDTRQPDPSAGTAVQLAKQNRILRQTPTVLATRPEPLLMRVADVQANMRTAFSRLTATTTGSISATSGSTNAAAPTADSQILQGGNNTIAKTFKLTLGGLR